MALSVQITLLTPYNMPLPCHFSSVKKVHSPALTASLIKFQIKLINLKRKFAFEAHRFKKKKKKRGCTNYKGVGFYTFS
jgi:hypothetical protein